MIAAHNSSAARGVRPRTSLWMRLIAVVGVTLTGSFATACPLGVGVSSGFSLALLQQNSPQGYKIDCTTVPSSTPLTAADGDTGILSKSVSGTGPASVFDALGTFSVTGTTTASGTIDIVHGVFSAAATSKGFGVAESDLRLNDRVTLNGVGSTHATLQFLIDGRAFGSTGLPQTASGTTHGRTSTDSHADIGIDIIGSTGASFQELQLRNGGEFVGPVQGFAGSFGPMLFTKLVNPFPTAPPLTTTGSPDTNVNSLSSYDYNIGGSGLTLYSFDLGMLNAGDMVNIGLQLDPIANCQRPTLNADCTANALVTSYVSLHLDPGFTAHSSGGFNYTGIEFLASQGACTNPSGCGSVGVGAPASLALTFPGLLLLMALRRRLNHAAQRYGNDT